MYERSAIVLERYLQTTLGYRKRSNLKNNYKNYCKLIDDVERYQEACVQEKKAVKEFKIVSEELEAIQIKQEKLYQKGAKLEYSRNIIFNNIETDSEEAERCILKIEGSLEKVSSEMVDLRIAFVERVKDYAVKKQIMQECKDNKKQAEIDYKESYKLTVENRSKIEQENIDFVQNFISSENEEYKKELVATLLENGEGEKNPFDGDVIEEAASLGIDIAKKEAESYLFIYEKTDKLLQDLEKRLIEINRYKRWARDITVKLNFLAAEREYLVQFLDYERITILHPKKTRKKLMEDACNNLAVDIVQINNLYELILKEIAGKCAKKLYKTLYNTSYLAEIELTEENFQKEKNKINTDAVTLINSNYWRIEGLTNIYSVFYNEITNEYGKDLDEFELPKSNELEDSKAAEVTEEEETFVEEQEEVEEEKPELVVEEKEEIVEEESDEITFIDSEESENSIPKDFFEEDDDDDENNSEEDDESNEAEVAPEEDSDDEDYELDFKEEESSESDEDSENASEEKAIEENLEEDDDYIDDDFDFDFDDDDDVSAFESEEDFDNYITDFDDKKEESLWDSIDFEDDSNSKKNKNNKKAASKKEEKKGGLFKKLSKMNKKTKAETAE